MSRFYTELARDASHLHGSFSTKAVKGSQEKKGTPRPGTGLDGQPPKLNRMPATPRLPNLLASTAVFRFSNGL